MTHIQTGTILDAILARTTADLAVRKSITAVAGLEAAADSRPAPLSLRAALAGPDMSVIAEIKRASPSRGAFPVSIDPATVAKDYMAGGAAAISKLPRVPPTTAKRHFRFSVKTLSSTHIKSWRRGRMGPMRCY